MSNSSRICRPQLTALLVAAVLAACGDATGTNAPVPTPARPVALVLVSPPAASLSAGQQLVVTATLKDEEGRPLVRPVSWHSDNEAVASVSSNGTVAAVSAGSAEIVATSEGKTGKAYITVAAAQVPVARITLEADADGLEIGETVFLAATVEGPNGEPIQRQVTWTTTAPDVATVEGTSLSLAGVQGTGVGGVTITARVDEVSASVTFRVSPRPTFDLVYTRWTGTASAELFVLGLGGDAMAPVRLNAGSVSRDPSPSPDGTQVVFAVSQTHPTTGQPQNDLYIVNRNGLNMRHLTRMPGLEDEPVWSPDGRKILFHATDEGTQRSDLWTVNVDGTGLTNLTAAIGATMTDKRSPAWSFDGARIAFVGAVGGQHKIWIMNADGSNPMRITHDSGFDSSPSWSPTGDRIAFSRYNAAQPTFGEDIMIVPVATGVVQRLPRSGDQRQPAWSPDGHYIAVTGSAQSGHDPQHIYTMRPDGTGFRLRTVNPAWGGGMNPSWIQR